MADINMEGNVVEDIFLQAINSMPNGAGFIASMIASKKRRKPLNNQKLFKKTVKAMQNMNVGKEEDILKSATRAYLQKHFALPACDTSAYDIKVGRGKITLRYNPNSPGAVPFGFWLNKHGLQNKTISKAEQARTYTRLMPDEITSKITENGKWLKQKDIYKQRIAEMFSADSNQLAEIFKDNVPIRADFSSCEISNFDFSKYDLSGANFKGVKLNNCTFSKMEGADLTDAVINGCIFAGAELAATDFNKAKIIETSFDDANLKGCNFAHSEPSDVSFRNAVFKDTNLDFAQPKNVIFDSEKRTARESSKKQAASKTKSESKAPARTNTKAANKAADVSEKGKSEKPEKKAPGVSQSNKQAKSKTNTSTRPKAGRAEQEAAATKVKSTTRAKAPVQQPINM